MNDLEQEIISMKKEIADLKHKLNKIQGIIEQLDQDMLTAIKPYYNASHKIKDILGVTDDSED